ncbi:MAG: tripartite tricarboxylate transporter substrate binding protein [Actinomycetaceae bacterium]|nr:tripartite tricarboxylate transporter substrate binding protein [Actinomycetaceae bacterium]MDY5854085.1 tripartite tricarboxylate transporter substrate binding protein [Arcanobacterium sp.]
MKIKRSVSIVAVMCAVLSLSACGSSGTSAGSHATIPDKVEVVVPWAAGGGSDNATRQLLLASEKECKTSFVVSNKTGAAGATGLEAGARAKNNGKTLTDVTAEISLLPHLGNTNISYKDFTPVMRFASISPAFVVKADSPYQTIDDLADAMKAGKSVRAGTTGRGGIWDIAAGGFEEMLGAKFTERVPYDGGASIIAAVLGGHLEVAVLAAPEALAQVKSGDLRVLAIADDQRIDVFPDVPTLKESGYEWSAQTWFGIAGPAGMSDDLVKQYGDCLKKGWDSDTYQKFLKDQGYNATYMDAADFSQFLEEKYTEFGELIPRIYK